MHWPWVSDLLPDETFSSWFARIASGNGLSPSNLFRAALPGAYRYIRDLDRYVEPALLENLSERTGIHRDVLLAGTLARWAGTIFDEDDGRNKLQWLPVAGSEDGRRSFGQQVCPSCLREDSQPYLRTIWRLAFVTICPQHRRALVDRCPRCGEPIQVLRGGIDGPIRCWKCLTDLGDCPDDDTVQDDDVARQEHLLDIVQSGWIDLGIYGPVYSFIFFRILTLIFRLLATGRFAAPLRAWTEIAFRRTGPPPPMIARLREVELLNPRCRRELLRMAVFLLEDWPTRFVSACDTVGLSSRNLLKAGRTRFYPFAFAHAVERHLTRQHRLASAEEVESAKAYLQTRGIMPTFNAISNLFGVKLEAHRALAEPATNALPPGEGRYWKLDGVSSEVRLAARAAAARAGERLGAWVDRKLRLALDGLNDGGIDP